MSAPAYKPGPDSESVSTNQCSSKAADRRRPEKTKAAFRTIGEAASELGLKTHVLRFWETKFSQLSPMKRQDGRRFYRPEDMQILRRIQDLLHEQGMTIKGAKKVLAEGSLAGNEANVSQTPVPTTAGQSVRDLQDTVKQAVEGGAFRLETPSEKSKQSLDRLLTDLTDLKARLDEVRKTG